MQSIQQKRVALLRERAELMSWLISPASEGIENHPLVDRVQEIDRELAQIETSGTETMPSLPD